MLQNLIVACIVLLAAAYAASRYLPASWRRRVVHQLVQRGAAQQSAAKWLDSQASCGGGCDTCKACETPAVAPEPTGRRVIPVRLQR